MKTVAAIGLLLLLAACGTSDSRPEPAGSFFAPVCMPDGSVVYNQLANTDGKYNTPVADAKYCPWYKKP